MVTYNEDFVDAIGSGYVPMLKRPISDAQSNNGSALLVRFHTSDSAFYNGWLKFYDSSDTEIGQTRMFRDSDFGTIWSCFNGGGAVYTNGTINNVSIGSTNLFLDPGKRLADITKYRVFLTDGAQYQGTIGNYYDYLSVGPLIAF